VKGRPLQIIRDRGNGELEGDVFFFRVNAVSNASRGWPDLLHVSDWLDAFDQLLWEMVERARLARTFIWDVKLSGDQVDVDEWLRKNGEPPRSGSVRAHNEEIEWTAVAPELGSYETRAEAELVKAHISAGAGVPSHWLSAASDVNRATAQEMGAPTVRMLQRRQSYFLGCVKLMLRFAIEQAVSATTLRTDEFGRVPVFDDQGEPTEKTQIPWKLVQLQAPEISPRDSARAGQLLGPLTAGLATAEQQGWFGKQTARRVLASFLSQFGIVFDPADQVARGDRDDKTIDVQDEEPAPLPTA
jgi:hypothetical protein